MEDNNNISNDNIFANIEGKFDQLHKVKHLRSTLNVICKWIEEMEEETPIDISISLSNLLKHQQTDADLTIVLQLIYQILICLNKMENSTILIDEMIAHQLLDLLHSTKCNRLFTNLLSCVRLYLKRFDKNHKLIEDIWSNILNKQRPLPCLLPTDIDLEIVLHLFEDIINLKYDNIHEPLIRNTIKHLLNSDERSDRKYGIYLLSKSIYYFAKTDSKYFFDIAGTVSEWNTYVTILQNIEEEQSHLVLPALKNLDGIRKSSSIFNDWKIILYRRILKHNNILVNRWIIEYFFKSFVCNDLDAGLLHALVEASNRNCLYNYEGYIINQEDFSKFFEKPLIIIYNVITEINWKSIPLYVYLKHLAKSNNNNALSVKHRTIFAIAARIRPLTNYYLRQEAIDQFNKLFKDNINKTMDLRKYIKLLDTLYNESDHFNEYDCLFTRTLKNIANSKDQDDNDNNNDNVDDDHDDDDDDDDHDVCIPVKVYKLLRNNLHHSTIDLTVYLKFLKDLPKKLYNYFLYLACYITDDKNEIQEIIENHIIDYELQDAELSDLMNSFLNCCEPGNIDEIQLATAAAIHIYINNINYRELRSSLMDFLKNDLPTKTLLNLWQILKDFHGIPSTLIKEFCDLIISKMFKYKFYEIDRSELLSEIVKYLTNVKDDNRLQMIIKKLLESSTYYIRGKFDKILLQNLNLLSVDNDKYLFLNENLLTGDNRIETMFYLEEQPDCYFGSEFINKQWQLSINKSPSDKYLEHMMNCHKQITEKTSRHFQNSLEHRQKFRIACGILQCPHNLHAQYIMEIWNIALEKNNQYNILLIYEYIIAEYLYRYYSGDVDFFITSLTQIDQYPTAQQLSILAITVNCCKKDMNRICTKMDKSIIIKKLLLLSFGANYKVRLYAQVALIQFTSTEMVKCSGAGSCYGKGNYSCGNISHAIHNSLSSLLENKLLHDIDADIRLNTYQISKNDLVDVLSYVTCVPRDECSYSNIISDNPSYEKYRDFFLKTSKKSIGNTNDKSNDAISKDILELDQMQMKKTYLDDIIAPDGLLDQSKSDIGMIVVASLIDNLPNLGGIARSCEVFGIRQLVLKSKQFMNKPDFTNLSMTAERSLDIIEVTPENILDFVLEKRLEGYQIVGAEQTANSVCFTDFQFNTKCVLILGHEKSGIPAPLLKCLDFAVEIPQVGKVRSLNVHVSAALFMWQFSKQHI